MKATSLTSRNARKKLEVRHPPHWQKVTPGISVGYRNNGGRPSWFARIYDKAGDKYLVKVIDGIPDDEQTADGSTVLSYQDAVQRAVALNPVKLKEHERNTKHAKTVDDIADKYFTNRRVHARSLDGLAQDQLRFRVFIKPKLGGDKIAALTAEDLQGWLNAMVTDAEAKAKTEDEDDAARRERQRKAKATANRVWTILRAILNYGFKYKYAPTHAPWRSVEPFKGVSKPRKRFLSQAEAFAVLKALDPKYAPLTKGGLYTGLRLGELLAMRVADVKDGQVYVPPRKTNADPRHVPMNKEGVTFFAGLTKGRPDSAPVFGIDDTKAMRVDLGRKLRKAFQAAGIPPIVFHDMRRSYGSLMLNSGASMSQISVLLGHADERMTRATYGHLTQDNLAKAISKHLPSFDENAAPKKKRKAKKAQS